MRRRLLILVTDAPSAMISGVASVSCSLLCVCVTYVMSENPSPPLESGQVKTKVFKPFKMGAKQYTTVPDTLVYITNWLTHSGEPD